MPSTIAIRMYCVNLLDIVIAPQPFQRTEFGRFREQSNMLQPGCAFATRFPIWDELLHSIDSVHNPCSCTFHARPLHQERPSRGENAMSDTVNRQVLLVEKPAGKLGPEHFKMSETPIPEPKDGEALLRVRYISLDAANRAWMHGATYRAAVEPNTVMAGGGIAEVVSSKAPGLTPGTIVFGDTGWQDYAAVPAKQLTRMPTVEPMTHLLSV